MYFFDTYALVELIRKNENYIDYLNYPLRVSILNIAELYWNLIKEFGIEKAKEWMQKYEFDILELSYDVMLSAVEFRYKYKKQDISLPDAAGYLLAKKHGLRFLTGDKEFENFDNVEFVK